MKLFDEQKMKGAVNKVWNSINFHDIASDMLDIKSVNTFKNTSVYQTHKYFKHRLFAHPFSDNKQKNYELNGIDEWFNKWPQKKYNNAFG